MVAAPKPSPCLRSHAADAVERVMFPGSSSSGFVKWPDETWSSHSGVGRNQTRPENESRRPKSKSQRFSSGSRPRVLPIDERPSVERLSRLKDLAVSIFAHGRGIQAEHAGERQSAMRCVAAGHAHPPVRKQELVSLARTSLMVEFGEQDAVLHELPTRIHGHVHVFVL